jgi:hypothetical protein
VRSNRLEREEHNFCSEEVLWETIVGNATGENIPEIMKIINQNE